MRIVLIAACALAFAISAWSNLPSTADAGQGATATTASVTK
jgi:hypothetical protein